MDTLIDRAPGGPSAKRLVVMLPGAYSAPQEFVREGFVAALRSRAIAADVVIADAHVGYYNDQSILSRLAEDIVRPARAEGYRAVWLVGISLGGFAALAYAMEHPDEVAGVVALAPYPGTRDIQREIAEAGGLKAWSSHAEVATDDRERQVWRWLARRARDELARPQVYIGYGEGDRFAAGLRMMAATLPASGILRVAGGHDWPAWRALWEQLLERGALGAEPRGD